MSAAVAGIVGMLGAASNLVVGILGVSFQCGALIVASMIAGGRLAVSLATTVAEAVTILYQDFCIFSVDLISRIVDAASLCFCFLSGVASFTKTVYVTVKDSLVFIFESITGGFNFGFSTVSQGWEKVLDLAEMLKWCLVVTGQGVWFAIQLVPLCIVYLLFSILSLAGMIISETVDKVQSALLFSSNQSALAFQWVYIFVTDFPVEAFLGLIIAMAISYWVHMNKRSISQNTARVAWKTCRIISNGMGYFWCMLARCLQFGRRHRSLLAPNYESDEEDVPLALRLRARKSLSPGSLKRQLLIEQEEKLCVVCLAQNKCVILMPCRHLCMCSDCSAIVSNTSGACPICRTDFERMVTVYM